MSQIEKVNKPEYLENKLYEGIFFLSYTLWLTSGVLNLTMFRYIETVSLIREYAQNIAYLLLVCLFFVKKRDKVKDGIGIGLILICCILARHSVYNTFIIPTAIYLYFSTDVDFKKILKCTLLVQAVIMSVTIFCSQMGVIEDVIWTQHGTRVRHSLGYDYCAYPAHLLLFMSLIWFSLRKKLRIAEMTVVLALNYVVYYFTDSRADFLLAVVGVVGFLIWQRDYQHRWINAVRSWTVKLAFPVLAVLSVIVQAFYNPENNLMSSLNSALSGRLRLGNSALQTYGLTLFGQNVRWFGQGSLRTDPTRTYNYVDNAFLKDGISFGIIFLILLAIGFYLAGKVLIEYKEYKLTWAMIMSLAYGVINAHLCMLTFNVFILLLGYAFSGIKWEKGKIRDRITSFLQGWGKRTLRVAAFLAILVAVTYAQVHGTSYIVRYSRMFNWFICGLLFLLSILCWENRSVSERSGYVMPAAYRSDSDSTKAVRITGSRFGILLLVFLILLCISDFFIDKRFRYAAFGMLAFGGIFCICWKSMKHPGQILTEFKLAYKIWFAAAIIFCVFCRPWTRGYCYSGMYPDADSFALAMLIALIVFLSDLLKEKTAVFNGIGAVLSLYLIWISHVTEIVLIAGVVLIAYAAFYIWRWVDAGNTERKQRIASVAVILVCGAGVVLIVRLLLPVTASALGTEVIYEKDKVEKIAVTLPELLSIDGWKALLGSKWYYCKEYLKNLNLLGHNYLLEINGKNRWAANSIMMAGYRYGVIAGIAYLFVLVSSFVLTVKNSLKNKDFFLVGITLGCTAAAMVMPIEKPFACLTWLILWFSIAGSSVFTSDK